MPASLCLKNGQKTIRIAKTIPFAQDNLHCPKDKDIRLQFFRLAGCSRSVQITSTPGCRLNHFTPARLVLARTQPDSILIPFLFPGVCFEVSSVQIPSGRYTSCFCPHMSRSVCAGEHPCSSKSRYTNRFAEYRRTPAEDGRLAAISILTSTQIGRFTVTS